MTMAGRYIVVVPLLSAKEWRAMVARSAPGHAVGRESLDGKRDAQQAHQHESPDTSHRFSLVGCLMTLRLTAARDVRLIGLWTVDERACCRLSTRTISRRRLTMRTWHSMKSGHHAPCEVAESFAPVRVLTTYVMTTTTMTAACASKVCRDG